MTDKEEQLERMRHAVERKNADAEAASRADRPVTAGAPPEEGVPESQPSLTEAARPQDTFSVRDKSSQKGKKTADKWNQ
jgi:hypothetical protein